MLVVKGVIEEGNTAVVCEECGAIKGEGEEIIYIKIGINTTCEICEDCADTLQSELHDNLF